MDHHPTSPVIRLQISHRSVRRYTRDPIAGEILAALIRAGQGAASSSFIHAYSVLRVTRPAARHWTRGIAHRLARERCPTA
jgi:nitroreductase